MTIDFGAVLARDPIRRSLIGVVTASDSAPVPAQALEKQDFRFAVPAHGVVAEARNVPVQTPRTQGWPDAGLDGFQGNPCQERRYGGTL